LLYTLWIYCHWSSDVCYLGINTTKINL